MLRYCDPFVSIPSPWRGAPRLPRAPVALASGPAVGLSLSAAVCCSLLPSVAPASRSPPPSPYVHAESQL